MKKWMLVIMAMVLVLSVSGSVFASGSFTSNAVHLGKNADGLRQVKISWNPPAGVSVSHYEVKRYDFYDAPYFTWIVCTNVTTTTCTDTRNYAGPYNSTIVKGFSYDYFVTAYLTDGTKIEAPKTRILIRDYMGAPAVPTVTFVPAETAGFYYVGFSITNGNNADVWQVYQNDVCLNCGLLFQDVAVENGTAPQSKSRLTKLVPGTNVYKVRLKNDFGETWSEPLTIVAP
ncbi:hypothetical protein [Paenibacillus taiwanensis]|uniref:hypothetical protein n=1 Tax=Paenibacillus taiwanensis TaxID=401638 RepID=UPI0003F79CFB|nr:hypothetical protein [Paenibacillus taiwanensis]